MPDEHARRTAGQPAHQLFEDLAAVMGRIDRGGTWSVCCSVAPSGRFCPLAAVNIFHEKTIVIPRYSDMELNLWHTEIATEDMSSVADTLSVFVLL